MAHRDTKKIIKIVLMSALFVFIVLYGLFNARNLIFGVKIKEVNMVYGTEGEKNVVKITGNAKNAKILSLNGREISIDQAGNFNETIALLPGYNIISLKAEDKFGLKDEEDYQLIGK
jgi:Glucodextranase, domain B